MRKRRILAGLLAVIAMLASACAGGLMGSRAEVPCPPAIEAPVLYPGDTWTWRYEDGSIAGQTYSEGSDGLLRARRGQADVEYYYDHTHTLRKVFSKGQWVTAPTQEFWDIGKQALVFPLTPGRRWVTEMPPRGEYTVGLRTNYTVEGCEQVTVPAGTFLALRIDLYQMEANKVGTPEQGWTLWYAPAVKHFVKQRTSGFTAIRNPKDAFELEFFAIDAGQPVTK